MLSTRRDLPAARAFFARALTVGVMPTEVTTDRAPAYPRVLDEYLPAALDVVEQYAKYYGRSRSRPAQSMAAANARPETLPVSADPGRRARVRAEPAPWPLRNRHR